MSLISVLCTAALIMTAFDIIVGARSVRLRPIPLRTRDAHARRQ
ncbi:MAG: hypothetical protein JWP02_2003 [Acidimicrobiales bacterium]|nr:hypothetical protein [Acidimicrobiales bacterium]